MSRVPRSIVISPALDLTRILLRGVEPYVGYCASAEAWGLGKISSPAGSRVPSVSQRGSSKWNKSVFSLNFFTSVQPSSQYWTMPLSRTAMPVNPGSSEQNSGMSVHHDDVMLPPRLYSPVGHVWQAVPFQNSSVAHVHMTYCMPIEPVGHAPHACPFQNSSAAQHIVTSPPRLLVATGQSLHAAPSKYSLTAHHLLYGLQSKSATLTTSPSGMYFHASNSTFDCRVVLVRSITYPSSELLSEVIAAVVSTTFPSASLKSTFMF
mmetsp:Transcript_13859/g.60527  ORF Transcript_13859/g.60527 Transcript_13859/m.60527 type:complete len:264 (+) Transcript_13859:478-1269(+)